MTKIKPILPGLIVSFIIAGFVQNAWIMLPIAIVLLVLTVFGIKYVTGKIKSK